jgi:hypothetical protein
MNKQWSLIFGLTFCLLLGFVGCKKKDPPLAERIAKAWAAESVRHDNTQVFTKGGSSNAVPGYSNYVLILGSDNTVQLTEFDGTNFTGVWELQGDTRLILKNLGPEAPTGSNGVLEFTIKSIEDSQLVLSRISPSVKTGNTVNEYTLSVR